MTHWLGLLPIEVCWDGEGELLYRHWVQPKDFALLPGSCVKDLPSYCLGGDLKASAAFWMPARPFCHLPPCFMCFPFFLHLLLLPRQSPGVKLLTSLVFPLMKRGGGRNWQKGGEKQLWLFFEGPVLSASSSGLLKSSLPPSYSPTNVFPKLTGLMLSLQFLSSKSFGFFLKSPFQTWCLY